MTKRKIIAAVFSCVAVLGWCWFPAFAGTTGGATPPHIIIGEVAWAGSSLSTADEWLELWNLDATGTNIGGWTLRGASTDPLILPATATIPGLGVYLISNYAQTDTKSVLATTSQLVTTAVSLSNSALQISLTDQNGQTIDVAGTGKAPPAGKSGAAPTSMYRDVATNAWLSATGTKNMKPGVPDLATPGWCDGCSVQTGQDLEISAPDPLVPTSTDQVQTTSTEEMTVTSTIEVEVVSNAPTIVEDETPLVTTLPNPTPAPRPPDPLPKPNYHLLRLNEVGPAPAKGKEWIEVISLDKEKDIPLTGCEVHDAKGRILQLKRGKIAPGQHLVLRLSRAVLANAGDTVSLYAPDGGLIESLTYGKTKKGEGWARFPDAIGDWQAVADPTPGLANVLTEPVQMPSVASSTEEIVNEATTTVEMMTDETETPPVEETVGTTSSEEVIAPLPKQKKIKKPKTADLIHPFTFDMLPSFDADGPVRVSLRGRVGTPPGLIKARSFVLQAPDGRGLLVTATTDRKLPPPGQAITLTGRLTAGDDGALLKLHADDAWSPDRKNGTASSTPRNVDLFAPSGQDIWSLVAVTGTVQDVKGRKVLLDADGVTLEMNIASRLPYRPQRLKKGDVLHVLGILAPAMDTPRLYPRSADDIVLMQHAPVAQLAPDKPQEHLPLGPWTPVGATAGAIGVAEGAKLAHRKRKERKRLQRGGTEGPIDMPEA